MRRTRASVVAMAVVTALFVVPGAVLAHATDDDKGDKDKGDKDELTLYASEASNVTITREGEVLEGDEGDEVPPEVGDRFLATDVIYEDAKRRHEVGRNYISCEVADVEGELPAEEPEDPEDIPFFSVAIACSGILDLEGDGQLTWAGLTSFGSEDFVEEPDLDEPFIVIALTGGTQKFIGASGEVEVFDEEAPSEEDTWTRYEIRFT